MNRDTKKIQDSYHHQWFLCQEGLLRDSQLGASQKMTDTRGHPTINYNYNTESFRREPVNLN